MAEFIAAGPPESLEFTVAQSWDEQRTRLSYLKAAYIIVFARWGYHMIMSPAFKPIRRQLREPTTAWLRRPPVMWRTDWPAGLYHARHATLGDMALVARLRSLP